MTSPESSRDQSVSEQADRVDPDDPRLLYIIEQYGDVLVKDPDFGKPKHDVEIMPVSETPKRCLPFIKALLRTETDEDLEFMIDLYRAPDNKPE